MTPEQLKKANSLKHQIEVLEIKIHRISMIINIPKLTIKIEDATPGCSRYGNSNFYEIDDMEFENLVRLKLNSDIEQCNLKIKTLQEEFDNL